MRNPIHPHRSDILLLCEHPVLPQILPNQQGCTYVSLTRTYEDPRPPSRVLPTTTQQRLLNYLTPKLTTAQALERNKRTHYYSIIPAL